jgi:hypothetical protein
MERSMEDIGAMLQSPAWWLTIVAGALAGALANRIQFSVRYIDYALQAHAILVIAIGISIMLWATIPPGTPMLHSDPRLTRLFFVAHILCIAAITWIPVRGTPLLAFRAAYLLMPSMLMALLLFTARQQGIPAWHSLGLLYLSSSLLTVLFFSPIYLLLSSRRPRT